MWSQVLWTKCYAQDLIFVFMYHSDCSLTFELQIPNQRVLIDEHNVTVFNYGVLDAELCQCFFVILAGSSV